MHNDVFISYSRRDADFVQRLVESLHQHNFAVWVDRDDIPTATPWRDEINIGIEGADTVIFVISPDSLKSEYCTGEITHARKLNKRIIPIIYRGVMQNDALAGDILHTWFGKAWENDARANWGVLKDLNWLFFDGRTTFETALQTLVETLQTNIEHVRTHTTLSARARDWENSERDDGLLLRGADLHAAQAWLTTSASTPPVPTPLLSEYIALSDAAAKHEMREHRLSRLTRILAVTTTVLFLIALVVSIVAVLQERKATNQANLAATAQNEAQIQALNAVAAQNALATSESVAQRQAVENLSYGLAADAARLGPAQGLALAVEAVNVGDPPLPVQRTLADLAYAPGVLRQHTAGVLMKAIFSPNGRFALTTFYEDTIIVWDADAGTARYQFAAPEMSVIAAALSADGRTIYADAYPETGLTVWDAAAGDLIATWEGHQAPINSIALSPDGQTVLSGDESGVIITWDAVSGALLDTRDTHHGAVNHLIVSPDGESALSAGEDGVIICWDLASGEEMTRLDEISTVNSIALSRDGNHLLAGGNDGTLVLWDLPTMTRLHQWAFGNTRILNVGFSADGNRVFANGVRVGSLAAWIGAWDTHSGAEIGRYGANEALFGPIVLSQNGRLALAAREHEVRPGEFDYALVWWDLDLAHVIQRVATGGPVQSVTLSPNGQTALMASCVRYRENPRACVQSVLEQREVTGGGLLRQLAGHADAVYSVAISPDGQTALSGGCARRHSGGDCTQGEIILWQLADGAMLRRWEGHTAAVTSVAFSSDGREALTASLDSVVIRWDIARAQPLKKYTDPDSPLKLGTTAIFTPDDAHILTIRCHLHDTGTQNPVYACAEAEPLLLDVATGTSTFAPGNQEAAIHALDVSPDGEHILAGLGNGTLALWEVASGERRHTYRQEDEVAGAKYAVFSASFSPDGQVILSGSRDGMLTLWDTTTGDVLRRFDGYLGPVSALAFNGDRAITGGEYNAAAAWRIDTTLDELVALINDRRHMPQLTCEQRARYYPDLICAEKPVATPTPTPIPSLTSTPALTDSPSPTPSLTAIRGTLTAQIGENPGNLADQNPQTWQYTGQAGDMIDIVITAETVPPPVYVRGPGGDLLAHPPGPLVLGEDIPGPAIQGLQLPTGGTYMIEVHGTRLDTPAQYTLVIQPAATASYTARFAGTGDYSGELPDGGVEQFWFYEGPAGERLVVDINEDAAEVMLWLYGPDGEVLVEADTEEGDHIDTALPVDGIYLIGVYSFWLEEPLPYTLTITSPPTPD